MIQGKCARRLFGALIVMKILQLHTLTPPGFCHGTDAFTIFKQYVYSALHPDIVIVLWAHLMWSAGFQIDTFCFKSPNFASSSKTEKLIHSW